jgi:hypothetical protein
VEPTKRTTDSGHVDALQENMVVVRQNAPRGHTLRNGRQASKEIPLEFDQTFGRRPQKGPMFVTGGGNVVPVLL